MRNSSGFTLIETMIALSLFGFVIVPIMQSAVQYLRYNTEAEWRTEALQVAQRKLEELREVDPTTLPSSGSQTSSMTAGTRSYSVVTAYCNNSSYCTTNSRHIKVTVSYKSKARASMETVYTALK
ncbi:type II secretion system protein [bacterium]|nr:type II secretion system protein [bacterium]